MKQINLEERQRIVKNALYLQTSLEDVLYSSPSFTIEKEEGTYVKFSKTRISFNSLHSNTQWSWVTPEIDKIEVKAFESEHKYLFTTLKSYGYTSLLIELYASLESTTSRFPDPHYDNILFKRVASVSKKGDEKRILYKFHLNAGSLYFHRILELDPQFWIQLLKASKEQKLLFITELHLASDCDQNLMKYVNDAIAKGHYETNGLRPFGFYWLQGEKKYGALGKRSRTFRTLKRRSFSIETLYFGDSRFQPVSIVIYNKDSEQLQRKGAVASCHTRVELRLSSVEDNPLDPDLIESIILSYFDKQGCTYRTRIFLSYVVSQIRFSNHFNDAGPTDFALWWRHQFIIPLAHAALPSSTTPKSRQLNPSFEKFLLPESATTKRGRGRPKGSKDKTPRKKHITALQQVGPIVDV